ncbi:MAG TPA: DNA-protecting protein DprA, partial [Arenimonas sp.]|nr:DNA-protecting protein DprA [Arenimonas sp.]
VETPSQVVAALGPLAQSLAHALRGQLEPTAGDDSATAPGLASHSARGQPGHDTNHKRLWSALGHDPTPVDELARRTGLTVAELSSMLLVMELDGRVVADNGRFARHP